MKNKIRSILTDLERVRENLLALSDDIWLSIDHNDNESLEKGVKFKSAYNKKLTELDRLGAELSTLIQQFTDIHIEAETVRNHIGRSAESNERVNMELDKNEPHSLDESFTHQKPVGFVLRGKAFTGLNNWKGLYERVCHFLTEENPALFAELPDHPSLISNRGNRAFSKKPSDLRRSLKITDTVFAETNLSADHIRDEIVKLLEVFQIPESEMRIYLCEDRDAE